MRTGGVWGRRVGIAALVAVALALPLVFANNRFAGFVLGLAFIHIMWASGMNLVYGYTGPLPMMYAGIAGIAAYTTVNLVMRAGWSFWLALPLGSVAAALIGVMLGLPALRLRGFFFILSSLVIQSALTIMFVYFIGITNGDTGITQIPPPGIWWPGRGVVGLQGAPFTFALAVATVITVCAVYAVVHSTWGAYMVAIREDDMLTDTLGINVTAYKVLAFFLSSLIAGVGGALSAPFVGFISPRSFDVLLSLNIWLMVAFGGRGTILGPIIGAAILAPLPFFFQGLYMLKDVIYGLLIIVVTMFLPAGIYGGLLPRLQARFSRRSAVLPLTSRI